MFNLLLPSVPYSYPLKTSENLSFPMISRGIKREHQVVRLKCNLCRNNGSHNFYLIIRNYFKGGNFNTYLQNRIEFLPKLLNLFPCPPEFNMSHCKVLGGLEGGNIKTLNNSLLLFQKRAFFTRKKCNKNN